MLHVYTKSNNVFFSQEATSSRVKQKESASSYVTHVVVGGGRRIVLGVVPCRGVDFVSHPQVRESCVGDTCHPQDATHHGLQNRHGCWVVIFNKTKW